MVVLHRLKGAEFVLNSELIESIEANPDTVITLTNDRKYIVAETIPQVIDLIVQFKRRTHNFQETLEQKVVE